MAAIKVGQSLGCRIFVTVDSDDKRKYLSENNLLPVDNILSSDDSSFENKILTATNGLGVDVVLNLHSGYAIESNTAIIAENGLYVDISANDGVFNNSGRSISYNKICLKKMYQNYAKSFTQFSSWFYSGVEKGFILYSYKSCIYFIICVKVIIMFNSLYILFFNASIDAMIA